MTSLYTPWLCIWCRVVLDFESCVHDQGKLFCSDCGGAVGAEEPVTPAVTTQAA